MTTRLLLYNKALQMAGEREISTLSDSVESRRLLDNIYNSGGIDECLSEGQWSFAMRTIQSDYDTSITPTFGPLRAHTIPSDFIILSAFCSDAYFNTPIRQYWAEAGNWYCDVDTVYIRYVSNDSSYGGNLGSWPAAFTEYAAAHFAVGIALKLGNPERFKMLTDDRNPKGLNKLKLQAKSRDAMNSPEGHLRSGSWTSSRTAGGGHWDGGSYSNLTG